MDSTEEKQREELTAIRSIYSKEFIECPPPTAWKGAARLHEFILRIPHPENEDISFDLRVKFPKTYPSLACPVFSLEKPTRGINDVQATKLLREINAEAQKLKGREMILEMFSFSQDWLLANITPPVEAVGSLALQMNQRAMEEARERHNRELEEAERMEKMKLREQQILQHEIEEAEKRLTHSRNRQRSNSESTETPQVAVYEEADFMTETFGDMYTGNGVKFNTVKLYHPRTANLGMVYMAEPILEDGSMAPPLELYVVSFQSKYYLSTQGRKKLSQVEQEIKDLIKIRHPKLLAIYAEKLIVPGLSNSHANGSGPIMLPQLLVLMEQAPALTLHDVLEDCESFREDRASDYVGQILTALNALHLSGLLHKGINAKCISLTSAENPSQPKSIKLCRASFHTRLLDLHRSNDFGPHTPPVPEEPKIPEGWASDVVQNESSLVYTKQRDIHDVGLVLMQMLMGLNVAERFPDAASAIRTSAISPMLSRQIMLMLEPPKGVRVTCDTLLSDLDGVMNSPTTGRGRVFTFSSSGPGLGEPRTPMGHPYGSPEAHDFFRLAPPTRAKQMSRWKEDWEELELLGKGAFGSVVKARNKIDSRIYAVKKIRLKTMQSDTKIFREVNALSRLSHRNIVRYYTTWVETYEPTASTPASDSGSGTESGTESEDNLTSVPDDHDNTSERHLPVNGTFQLSIEDFDDLSVSRSSFPSIHFSRSGSSDGSSTGSGSTSSGDDDKPEDEFSGLFMSRSRSKSASGPKVLDPLHIPHAPPVSRVLYIQMEFVERQTLKERIEEGIAEDEAWRLFQQIVDALSHMSTLNILHRDIKLTNIFIDAKGDCKVGDFGLATSSLAAVDPSDVSTPSMILDAELTLEVGTRLYIAPEVQSRRRMRGPRDHSKADMYSLGVVFFEMNFRFYTGSERIAVLEDLRKPSIIFPPTWEVSRSRQREIITWLLQHEPDKRPTAFELSNSSLLPTRLEDEYYKNALRLMAKTGSKYHEHVLETLFSQQPSLSTTFTYDSDLGASEYASLNNLVEERLAAIFHLRGAVDMEPPLLIPVTDPEQEKTHATFVDRRGDLIALPNNILVPFARLSARRNTKRIKRYHITNVFRPSTTFKQPLTNKAAMFDIITPDLQTGPTAAAAEIIAVASDVLDSFPDLAQQYDIHVSHSTIVDVVVNRIPVELRAEVTSIIERARMNAAQKRNLAKKGLPRNVADEIDILWEIDDDVDGILSRLERISPTLVIVLKSAFQEVKNVIQLAHAAGVSRQIFFRPLMVGSHHVHFKDGVLVEVVKRDKPTDVLAAGGRYDALISKFKVKLKPEPPIAALGIQISVEKITAALEVYQSSVITTLIKEERSFGYWSPRRCDVYVVSYQPGYLQERLEVVSYLWQNNISADLMYESGLPDSERDTQLGVYRDEGILFTVYPRPRNAHGRNLAAFKVKSLLKGTEVELSKQELVSWLQQQITEQKRVDLTTSGAPILNETPVHHPVTKDPAVNPHIHVVLHDAKKQRKNVKQLFEDKAFEKSLAIKTCFQNGMSVLAVDVSPALFDAMTKNAAWITDDDAWKPIASMFPAAQPGYAHQIRETASRRKAEGHPYILLFAVKEDRAQLLNLS